MLLEIVPGLRVLLVDQREENGIIVDSQPLGKLLFFHDLVVVYVLHLFGLLLFELSTSLFLKTLRSAAP